jgi:ATP-dependent DNA ligase
MSSIPGKGKNAGRHGSLVVGLYTKAGHLRAVAQVGKGNDAEWRDKPISSLLGKVVEVSHEGVQAKGMLKFSCFERFREDKRAEDCTMDQLDLQQE